MCYALPQPMFILNLLEILIMIFIPPLPEGGGGYTVLPLSVLPSVQDIFRRIFLSNCWWQKSDIWSQASYRYTILWVAFLDPSDSYFLFADLVGFYAHWTYIICTFFSASIALVATSADSVPSSNLIRITIAPIGTTFGNLQWRRN